MQYMHILGKVTKDKLKTLAECPCCGYKPAENPSPLFHKREGFFHCVICDWLVITVAPHKTYGIRAKLSYDNDIDYEIKEISKGK